jgi:HEAT repeat protein
LWQIGVYAKDATPALLALVNDPNVEVRAMVAQALGRTGQGSQAAVPALAEDLKDGDASVRSAAAHALAEIWLAAKVAAAGNIGLGRPGTARAAPGPMKLDPESEKAARPAISVLTMALEDSDVRVRTHAAEALVAAGPLAEPATAPLIKLLKDPDDDARLQATLALGGIGPKATTAVAPLAVLLYHDKNFGIRVNAATGLGEIRAHPDIAVPALVHGLLEDPNPDVKTQSLIALGRFGPEAKSVVPALQKAADDAKADAGLRSRLTQLVQIIEDKSGQKRDSTPTSREPRP